MSPTTSDQPTTTSISETMTTPTSSDPSGDPTGETEGIVCGDGEVEGDEVCDDGVNDGAYGGCMPDCSALAERCGDNTINGPEVCDDGVNDDSYGGCASDCTALGPHCGDGELQNAQEMCDNGAANANGSGCNVDCVTSGTLLYTYTTTLGGQCFQTTEPVVNADGNVLIATTGACDNVFTMRELSPELEEVDATEVLLPSYPYRAIMRGTDWIMASYECNWIVAADGELTEICDDTRNTGGDALRAIDDESYVALRGSVVAQFGAASPAAGDTPDWTAVGNTDSTNYSYDTWNMAIGALDSVVTSGQQGYYNGTSWTYSGYIERFNSTGSFLNSRSYGEVDYFNNIQSSPDGVIYLAGWDSDSGANRLIRLNSNLNITWNLAPCIGSMASIFVVDSAEQIVVECWGMGSDKYLLKLDEDGNELWSTDLEFEFDPNTGRLYRDAEDNILRIAVSYDSLNQDFVLSIEKFAP